MIFFPMGRKMHFHSRNALLNHSMASSITYSRALIDQSQVLFLPQLRAHMGIVSDRMDERLTHYPPDGLHCRAYHQITIQITPWSSAELIQLFWLKALG